LNWKKLKAFFGKGKTMRTNYAKVVVVAAMAFLLASDVACRAGEKKEDFWGEDRPRHGQRKFELTEERIERIMERLKETEPEKAEELEKLQEEDPNKFKAELRKTMRGRFGKKPREHGKKVAKRGRGGDPNRSGRPGFGPPGYGPPGFGPPGYGPPGYGPPGYVSRYELLEWLKKHYPEEAERMSDLSVDKPELYEKRMKLGLKRYAKIIAAEKENPELAAVLKEDLELKQQRDKLLRRIRNARDEESKQELVAELQEVVGARFDLIVKRKEMEYEKLRKRLSRLRRQVQKSEENVEKWKDADYKADNVKARVAELVGVDKEFKWE
jgi:hypothetical protein